MELKKITDKFLSFARILGSSYISPRSRCEQNKDFSYYLTYDNSFKLIWK